MPMACCAWAIGGGDIVAESKPPQAVTASAQKSAIDTLSALLYRTWCRYSFLMKPAPRTMNQAIDNVEKSQIL